MRLSGLMLLVAGWAITVFDVGLLHTTGARSGFVLAGLAIELLGLAFLIRSHVVLDPE
jgi:hypothetical protein